MHWKDISSWPNAQWSRRAMGPAHRWHLQDAGDGPCVLLIHGAGASTHSWRDVFPTLAERYRVLAIDLPGHGFTQLGARRRSGLVPTAEDIATLATQEAWNPKLIVGHSAGAAVALELSQRLRVMPKVLGINAALAEFRGLAGVLFPVMAKVLAAVPFTADLFAGTSGRPDRVNALIASTGSNIDEAGLALYARLIADRQHVDGTLQMMAQWDLEPLLDALPRMNTPTTFLAGARDATVPPVVSQRAAERMPDATLINWSDAGHLAHEEHPERTADLIKAIMDE